MLQRSNSRCSGNTTKNIFYSLIEGTGIPSMIYYMVNGIIDLVAENDIDDALTNASLGWRVAFGATFITFSAYFTYQTYQAKKEESRFKESVTHRLAALEQGNLGNINNDMIINIDNKASKIQNHGGNDQSSTQPLLNS